MAVRRSKRIWTEIETKELFELVHSTKLGLAALSRRAPIHSPIYERMSQAQETLAKVLQLVSEPYGAHGGPRARHYPEHAKDSQRPS